MTPCTALCYTNESPFQDAAINTEKYLAVTGVDVCRPTFHFLRIAPPKTETRQSYGCSQAF